MLQNLALLRFAFVGLMTLLCSAAEDDGISINEDIVNQLASMGFQYLHCQKAAMNTVNIGVEEAMNWLLTHMNDPGSIC